MVLAGQRLGRTLYFKCTPTFPSSRNLSPPTEKRSPLFADFAQSGDENCQWYMHAHANVQPLNIEKIAARRLLYVWS